MLKNPLTNIKRSGIFCVVISLALFVAACANFKKPTEINATYIKSRAQIKESNGIRVKVALVGDKEALDIFGIDLSKKNIQALWLEIENATDRSFFLLPTAIDPEYYAPLEVAFAFHKAFSHDVNTALDDHLQSLSFSIRSPIKPGTQVSGYIFTSRSQEVKSIDVDLLGNDFSQNFTFFATNPNSVHGREVLDKLDSLRSADGQDLVQNEADLRQSLEQIVCCVSAENDGLKAEPLNIVIIGALDDWITAFIRRGYRYASLTPRYAFGRKQDISGRKKPPGYIEAQSHNIRIWRTPIRYKRKPVWVGQISSRRGGRFAEKASSDATLPLDPNVDEARDDLTQDLAYSQALVKLGYVKGAGLSRSEYAGLPADGIGYTTDGLRVVLVFGDRPSSLSDIDFFNWERLADYR